jgi:biotin operon repressor
MSLFLTPQELRDLTGFSIKAKQIEQLRRQGIPFFVNGHGRPVVTVAAVKGEKEETAAQKGWRPAVLLRPERAA